MCKIFRILLNLRVRILAFLLSQTFRTFENFEKFRILKILKIQKMI